MSFFVRGSKNVETKNLSCLEKEEKFKQQESLELNMFGSFVVLTYIYFVVLVF